MSFIETTIDWTLTVAEYISAENFLVTNLQPTSFSVSFFLITEEQHTQAFNDFVSYFGSYFGRVAWNSISYTNGNTVVSVRVN